jgi:hypothetical protein
MRSPKFKLNQPNVSSALALLHLNTFFINYAGDISSIKVYNRALSADEIIQNFNAHRGRYGL